MRFCWRTAVLAVLILALLVAPVGARGPAPSVYPTETITVGVLRPTSFIPEMGQEMVHGIEMALTEATADGANIELVYADSGCNQGMGAVAIAQLIASHDVHYVLGALCSSASRQAAEVAEANGVVMISPTSTGYNISHVDGANRDYVFLTSPMMGYMAQAAAAEQWQRGVRNPVVIYDVNQHEERAEAFQMAWQELAGETVTRLAWDPLVDDPGLVAATAKALQPDALGLALDGGDVHSMAAACVGAGMDDLGFFGGETWTFGELNCTHLDGAVYTAIGFAHGEREMEKEWISDYETAWGETPGDLAAFGYDAAKLLFQAIATVGADDPAAVKDALYAIQFDGITGKGMFNAYGDTQKGILMIELDSACNREVVRTWGAITGLQILGPTTVPVGQGAPYMAQMWTGAPDAYDWNMGDGTALHGSAVDHAYMIPGAYTVTLEVDSLMGVAQTQTTVQVLPVQDQAIYLPLVMR